MNRADCKALRSAALELDKWRKAIEGMEFYGVEVRKYPRLIKRLRLIANVEQAKLPKTCIPGERGNHG